MFTYIKQQKGKFLFATISRTLVFVLSFSLIFSPAAAQAQTILNLPVSGTMIAPSPAFVPVLLKGMTIHPDDPLKFDFIIDSGNTDFTIDEIKVESEKLVKYFLASMTVPKDDLWVNLSPYEQDRIIPEELGKTVLGRDMLAQDYILKQLTASLMYPEEELGKKFWDKVYDKAEEQFGTREIPVNTFNKVWILPESATVYEHEQTVYIVNAHLKVMLDSDYVAMEAQQADTDTSRVSARDQAMQHEEPTSQDSNLELQSSIIKEIIIPEIEKEVNEGQHFAPLRQIYHSLILAKWYKETVKNSLLSQVYVDKNLTAGVESGDEAVKDQIYAQYMKAYEKGIFNYIKEDYDRLSNEVVPRKYFSGGIKDSDIDLARSHNAGSVQSSVVGDGYKLELEISPRGKSTSSPVSEAIQEQIQDDPRFASIFQYMHKRNIPFDSDLLLEVYKNYKDSIKTALDEPTKLFYGLIEYKIPPKHKIFLLKKTDHMRLDYDETREYLSRYGVKTKEKIRSDPMIDVLRNDFGVQGAFKLHRALVDEDLNPGSIHYGWFYETWELVVPEEAEDFVALYLTAGEEEMGRLIRSTEKSPLSMPQLEERLKEKGASNPQVDEHFVRIFNHLVRLHPDMDLNALLEIYRKVKKNILGSSGLGTGKVIARDDASSGHDRYGGYNYDRTITEGGFLDFLRNEMGIPNVYFRETAEGGTIDVDHFVVNPDHYTWQKHYDYYMTSPKFDIILRFFVEADKRKLPIKEAIIGKKEYFQVLVKSEVRVLGKEGVQSVIGKKEGGFLLFDQLKLPYPPGIVLSERLVKKLLGMSETEQLILASFIFKALSRAGIKVRETFQGYMIRSNPKTSMPGIFSSNELSFVLWDDNRHLEPFILAIKSVADSWSSEWAIRYRERLGLDNTYDMPIIIQKWIKTASDSRIFHSKELYAAGTFSTRDPNTNKEVLLGRYKENATGAALMTEGEQGEDINRLKDIAPEIYQEILEAKKKLEDAAGPQEVEFVIREGKLYFVQTRDLHFSPQAEFSYIKELLESGKMTEALAIPRLNELHKKISSRKIYRIKEGVKLKPFSKGAVGTTSGAFQGYLVWDIGQAHKFMREGKPIVFVMDGAFKGTHENTKKKVNEVLSLIFDYPKSALITSYGNGLSHEAVLTRLAGVPALINPNAYIDDRTIYLNDKTVDRKKGPRLREGDQVVIDGDNGILYESPEENVLEESGSIFDASYGIDIVEFGEKFLAQYLDESKTIREDLTVEDLKRLNNNALRKFRRRDTKGDKKGAFIANLEKHFLHELLLKRQQETASSSSPINIEKVGGIDLNETDVDQSSSPDDTASSPIFAGAKIQWHTWRLKHRKETVRKESIKYLLESFSTSDYFRNNKIEKALRQAGVTGEEIKRAYKKVFFEKPSYSRFEDYDSYLREKGFSEKEITDAYIEALVDKDVVKRRSIVVVLGARGDKKAIKVLKPLLNDADFLVKLFTVRALYDLGDSSGYETIYKVLDQMINDSTYDFSDLELAVIIFVKFENQRSRSLLLSIFNNDEMTDYIQSKVAQVLAKLRGEETFEFWIGELERGKPTEEALEALGNIGNQEAVDYIVPVMTGGGEGISVLAKRALIKLKANGIVRKREILEENIEKMIIDLLPAEINFKGSVGLLSTKKLITHSIRNQAIDYYLEDGGFEIQAFRSENIDWSIYEGYLVVERLAESSRNTSSPVLSKKDLGGIDMNKINVNREGSVNIQFDPLDVQAMIDMGITGFAPVIINLTPLPSILPLLGLAPREEEFEVSSLN